LPGCEEEVPPHQRVLAAAAASLTSFALPLSLSAPGFRELRRTRNFLCFGLAARIRCLRVEKSYRRLLRPRGKRPYSRASLLALPRSITSSAATCNVCGTVMPSDFAVLRLITSSNRVGCTTGSSAGLAPLRICAV